MTIGCLAWKAPGETPQLMEAEYRIFSLYRYTLIYKYFDVNSRIDEEGADFRQDYIRVNMLQIMKRC
jgi:hypothetical protein